MGVHALGVKPVNTSGSNSEPPEEISDTERAIYGTIALTELRAFLDEWAQDRLCSRIADVRFRAGRIDAVCGVDLTDGRAVVIKTHRPRGPRRHVQLWTRSTGRLRPGFHARFRWRDPISGKAAC